MAEQRGRHDGNVHWTRQAAGTPRLGGAAEDVGNEDVPVSIYTGPGCQLSDRLICNSKKEIIDNRSGSAVAVSRIVAFDIGGEKTGTVRHEWRFVGKPRDREARGKAVNRGRNTGDCRASYRVVEVK